MPSRIEIQQVENLPAAHYYELNFLPSHSCSLFRSSLLSVRFTSLIPSTSYLLTFGNQTLPTNAE
jgi:hypothetical protein